jgi:dienelactone hydrolase
VIKPGKHPVILFLHGCGGPRSPRTFLGLGAVVVAPNSFADGSGCKADAAYMVKLVGVRHGDIAYAAGQLKAATWADPGKLVLAGYSNGAQTTATYPGDEFKARVIVAWTCNNPRVASQNGVMGKGPALALLGTADEFYKKVGIGGDCNAALAKREGSRSILIKGGSHEILDHAETKAAVAAFVPVVIK